jgi:predicted dithiol-disulfide oxidoreductase (DUF899 family)
MSLPNVVSREQWLAARTALLEREKQHTRSTDALNTARRNLPMVKVEEDYRFEGPNGPASLLDLFEGRRQLVVQHFMFDPAWENGCPGCTAGVDEIAPGLLEHLAVRDTTFALVSRAPLAKLERYKAARGWSVPWYSSYETDFNYDFSATIDPAVVPILFNYRDAGALEGGPHEWVLAGENHPIEASGFSCFLREGYDVFHTYTTFARGTEQVGGAYGILDLTALGRQEEWEEPKGRAAKPGPADPSFGGFAA